MTLEDINDAEAQLRGIPTLKEHRRLLQAMAILASTAGHLLDDVGDYVYATRYYGLGIAAAAQADDLPLIAWSMGLRSIQQVGNGNAQQASADLSHAATLLSDGTNRRRLAWLHALDAKAQATLGNEYLAHISIDKARTALGHAPPATDLDFFDHARLDGFEGSVHLLLGNAAKARKALNVALDCRSSDDLKGRALLTMELAACQLKDGDPANAAAMAIAAIDLAKSQMVKPVRTAAKQLWHRLGKWSRIAEVRQLDDVLTELAIVNRKKVVDEVAGPRDARGL